MLSPSFNNGVLSPTELETNLKLANSQIRLDGFASQYLDITTIQALFHMFEQPFNYLFTICRCHNIPISSEDQTNYQNKLIGKIKNP
jgi:hypothetical protein